MNALEKMKKQLGEDSKGRTLLQKVTQTTTDENGITLICTIVCEEDIATIVEFSAGKDADESGNHQNG